MPGRRAVIVGLNEYDDQNIRNLTGAVNDAREVHDRLTKTGGFEVANHHYLTDDRATAANIRKAVSDLLWKTDPHELALLYFSGHGFTDSYRNGFIAPCDMIKDAPLVHGIRMAELRDLMLKAKYKQSVVMIFDCCYSGIAAEGEKAVSAASAEAIYEGFTFDQPSPSSGCGKIIYTSAGSDERSREDTERRHKFGGEPAHSHGVFTFELIEGLDGGASSGDCVTLGSLIRYVDAALMSNRANVKPRQYGSLTNALDSIFICTPKKQQDLGRRIEKIKAMLGATDHKTGLCDPLQLFDAIDLLETVLSDSPQLDEALTLRSLLDDRLKSYKACVNALLVKHYMRLAKISEEICDRLLSATHDAIDYDFVTRGDCDFRTVVLVLFKVAAGRGEIRLVESALTVYDGNRATAETFLTDNIDRRFDRVGA